MTDDNQPANATNADQRTPTPPPTPGRRSSRLSSLPLPPMSPLVHSVSARVLADAEKKLSDLQLEVDALKKKDSEREQELGLAKRNVSQALGHVPSSGPARMFSTYPDYDENADYGDLITDLERRKMREELEMQYRIAKQHMFKQMEVAFRHKQRELDLRKSKSKSKSSSSDRRKRRHSFGSPRRGYESESDEDASSGNSSEDEDTEWRRSITGGNGNADEDFENLKRARAKIDVVVCTTELVPGFRLVERCGTFKVVVPRSLLCYDDSPEEVSNAFTMAKMVRQEVMDKAVGIARRRKANAIFSFKYKTEMSKNIHQDDNVVLITATGNCGIIKKIFSEREVALRQSLYNSRKMYRRNKDVTILREVLEKQTDAYEKKAYARALSQMDAHDLRATLDELQGKVRASAKAKEKTDPHREALEKILGQKIRFDEEDPYQDRPRQSAGPAPRGRDVSAKVVEELLTSMLRGDLGRAAEQVTDQRGGSNWDRPGKDAPSEGGDDAWAAYDW